MSSKNPQSDYDQAFDLKQKGNACFKTGDLKGALKNYSRIFMHIGMNPCMNMSQMMGAGGNPNPNSKVPQQKKDPLQQQTDALRLTAFNNMAAVYAKMNKWDDCKEKCSRVLKCDDKNTKALFRRGMAYRKLNLYELARADLQKAKTILKDTKDAAIERELKLLSKDEKNADKEFMKKMKAQMKKAKKIKDKKKAEKEREKQRLKDEEAKRDDNPNLKANINGDEDSFMWDVPESDHSIPSPKIESKDVSNAMCVDKESEDKTDKTDSSGKDKIEETNEQSTEQPSEF